MFSPPVLIPDGNSSLAIGVVRSLARRRGRKVYTFCERGALIRWSRRSRPLTPPAGQALLPAVESFSHRHGRAILLPVDQQATREVLEQRDAFGALAILPPLPSLAAYEVASDKWHFAQFLHAQGLPHPPTTTLDPSRLEAPDVSFPLLLKPRKGSGGHGILRVDSASELREAVERDPRILETCIAQSFVPGRDVDCSVLCQDGEIVVGVTQYPLRRDGAAFGCSFSVVIEPHARVLAVARALMRALGWTGVAHIDLRYDADEKNVFVIEINPRYWGSLLASKAAGIDFADLACRMALGEQPAGPAARRCRYLSGRDALRWEAWRPRRDSDGAAIKTSLPFVLGDPMPELMTLAGKMSKQSVRKI